MVLDAVDGHSLPDLSLVLSWLRAWTADRVDRTAHPVHVRLQDELMHRYMLILSPLLLSMIASMIALEADRWIGFNDRDRSPGRHIPNRCIVVGMRPSYRKEPCKGALNRVSGMPFAWSLNPYTGCVHRCTFCYVRAFELRADRPPDDRYGRSIRVKVNVAEVLARELARTSWKREPVAIGAATDPYQPAEGHYRLTRACIQELGRAETPFSIITRGPLIVRDVDVLADAARRCGVSVTFSVPTLDPDVWRKTEPGTAPPRQRLRALR